MALIWLTSSTSHSSNRLTVHTARQRTQFMVEDAGENKGEGILTSLNVGCSLSHGLQPAQSGLESWQVLKKKSCI